MDGIYIALGIIVVLLLLLLRSYYSDYNTLSRLTNKAVASCAIAEKTETVDAYKQAIADITAAKALLAVITSKDALTARLAPLATTINSISCGYYSLNKIAYDTVITASTACKLSKTTGMENDLILANKAITSAKSNCKLATDQYLINQQVPAQLHAACATLEDLKCNPDLMSRCVINPEHLPISGPNPLPNPEPLPISGPNPLPNPEPLPISGPNPIVSPNLDPSLGIGVTPMPGNIFQ